MEFKVIYHRETFSINFKIFLTASFLSTSQITFGCVFDAIERALFDGTDAKNPNQ